MTKEEIKAKRKAVLKKEDFHFRILVALGIISYNVKYRENGGIYNKWRKTYKTVWYNPLTYVLFIFVLIFSICTSIVEAFTALKNEFKEKTYYC